MSNSDKNYEDIVLKTAHTYFGKELLPLWDIHEELEDDNGITEIPVLVLTNMYMDFTFLTKSGKYLHFEFQTTDGASAISGASTPMKHGSTIFPAKMSLHM